jgi:Cu/Ag efflux protein CusF
MRQHPSLQPRTLPLLAAVYGVVLALATLTTFAAATTYWSTIHAVVLSVDRPHKTVTVRSEALETVPAGVHVCAVHDLKALQQLRAGELIEARAETSHAEWTLDEIHVVGQSGSNQRTLTRMALR